MTTLPVTVTVTNASGLAASASASLDVTSTQTTFTAGETQILATADSGNGNLLVAQPITLTQQGSLQSLSFYVATAGGQIRLALYADSSGSPGNKIAEAAVFTPVVGWNTQPVTSQQLAPGQYWLSYLPQSDTLAFRKTGAGGISRYRTFAFGTMPATFAATSSTPSHWSFYGTFLAGASQPDTTAPSVPSGLSATAHTSSSISLSWGTSSDNVGVSGYTIFRNSTNIGTVPTTSFTDVGLQPSTSYTYWVSAFDAAGNQSGLSSALSVSTDASQPPPTGFPDDSSTGWQHTGVTLRAVPGQLTSGPGWEWDAGLGYVKITGANVTLDSLDISGTIFIDIGVTSTIIQRSRVSGSGDYLIRRYDDGAQLTITDVELIGGAVQVKGTFALTRVNAHSFTGKAAMLGSNASVVDSYIHGNICNPPDHQSGVGTNGGSSNMLIRHNNVDVSPTSCTSGGISNYDDFGAFHNITIENNLINAGGYALKAGFEDNNAAGNSGMQVLNNVFGRKYFSECGQYGPVSNWMPTVSGNVWSGNIWGDGAAATNSHAIGDPVIPS